METISESSAWSEPEDHDAVVAELHQRIHFLTTVLIAASAAIGEGLRAVRDEAPIGGLEDIATGSTEMLVPVDRVED